MLTFGFLGKLKGLFGGSSSTEEPTDAEDVRPRETTTGSSSSSSAASPSESAATEKEKKKAAVPVENTIPVTATPRFTTIAPLTVEQKKAARDRSVNILTVTARCNLHLHTQTSCHGC